MAGAIFQKPDEKGEVQARVPKWLLPTVVALAAGGGVGGGIGSGVVGNGQTRTGLEEIRSEIKGMRDMVNGLDLREVENRHRTLADSFAVLTREVNALSEKVKANERSDQEFAGQLNDQSQKITVMEQDVVTLKDTLTNWRPKQQPEIKNVNGEALKTISQQLDWLVKAREREKKKPEKKQPVVRTVTRVRTPRYELRPVYQRACDIFGNCVTRVAYYQRVFVGYN